jgi:hypothetical protein
MNILLMLGQLIDGAYLSASDSNRSPPEAMFITTSNLLPPRMTTTDTIITIIRNVDSLPHT